MKLSALVCLFVCAAGIATVVGKSVSSVEQDGVEDNVDETKTKCIDKRLSSWQYKRHEEDVNVMEDGKVTSLELVREHYRHAVICIKDVTFGFTASSMWVTKGCRATFRVCLDTTETFHHKMKNMVNDVKICKAKVQEHAAIVQTNKARIASNQNELSSKDARIDSLERDIIKHVDTNQEHQGSIRYLERAMSETQRYAYAQEDTLSTCKEDVSSKEKALLSKEKTISTLEKEMKREQNGLSTCRQEVSSKQQSLVSIQSLSYNLERDLKLKHKYVSECKQEAISKQKAISNQQTKILTLERTIASQQKEIPSFTQNIATLHRKIDLKNKVVSTLRQTVSGLTNKVASLTSSLKEKAKSIASSAWNNTFGRLG